MSKYKLIFNNGYKFFNKDELNNLVYFNIYFSRWDNDNNIFDFTKTDLNLLSFRILINLYKKFTFFKDIDLIVNEYNYFNCCDYDIDNIKKYFLKKLLDNLNLKPNYRYQNVTNIFGNILWQIYYLNYNYNNPISAILNDKYVLFKYLIYEKNMNPNIKDKNGLTSLFLAVKMNRIDFVKLLIDHKDTDINCRDTKNNTPIMLALKYNFIEIVILLLDISDLTIKNANNETFYSILIKKNTF